MKKLIASILSLTLVLCGCSSKSSVSDAPSKTSEVSQIEPSSTISTVTPPKTIKVAVLKTSHDSKMWYDVVEQFEQDNDNIKVTLVIEENLEDVVGDFAKSDFDVVHLPTGRAAGAVEALIAQNGLLDVSDVLSLQAAKDEPAVLQKLVGGVTKSVLTNPYNDGKTYMMPMFYKPYGLFYNKEIFAKNGWSPPQTWDEMWVLGDKAEKHGLSLFAYPSTAYMVDFVYALMYSAGGAEFFHNAANYSEGTWDTPEAQTVFDIVAKLATYTDESVVDGKNPLGNIAKNQQLILDNKSLFMPNGTWAVSELASAERADPFEWGFMALPAVATGDYPYAYVWIEQAWIPSSTKNPDLAKQFLAYLYSDKAARSFASSGAIQPIIGFSDVLEGDNKLFYSPFDSGAQVALGEFATVIPASTAESDKDIVSIEDAFFGTIDSLVSGTKTKKQWVDAIKIATEGAADNGARGATEAADEATASSKTNKKI